MKHRRIPTHTSDARGRLPRPLFLPLLTGVHVIHGVLILVIRPHLKVQVIASGVAGCAYQSDGGPLGHILPHAYKHRLGMAVKGFIPFAVGAVDAMVNAYVIAPAVIPLTVVFAMVTTPSSAATMVLPAMWP